jgi:exonuclease III
MWRRPCWNIGSITCKLSEFVERSTRRHVNISCVQETKWKARRRRRLDNTCFKLWFIGTTANRISVGVLIDKSLKNGMMNVRRKRDRIILVKLVVG